MTRVNSTGLLKYSFQCTGDSQQAIFRLLIH